MLLLIMQHMLYIQNKSKRYGLIMMEILAKKGVKVRSGDDSVVVKAKKKFNGRSLYKSHYYLLNGDWINKELYETLSREVK